MGQFPRVNSVATLQYPTCYSARATVTAIRPGPIRLQYSSYSNPSCCSTRPDTVPLGCYNHPPLGLDVLVEYQTNLNTRISSLSHVPYV